jgi:DNA replication protein DnaC
VALGPGLAAGHRGLAPGVTVAAGLNNELHEASDEKRPLCLLRMRTGYKLLIVDALGYVALSPTCAELLFEVFSRRYPHRSIIVASNLAFDEWTGVFAPEPLPDAPLGRFRYSQPRCSLPLKLMHF